MKTLKKKNCQIGLVRVLGKVAKKLSLLVEFRHSVGSAGIQIDTKLFYDLLFCWNVPEMV